MSGLRIWKEICAWSVIVFLILLEFSVFGIFWYNPDNFGFYAQHLSMYHLSFIGAGVSSFIVCVIVYWMLGEAAHETHTSDADVATTFYFGGLVSLVVLIGFPFLAYLVVHALVK